MGTLDSIKKLEAQSQFAGYTYEEQLRWRSAVLNHELVKEPAFINLTDNQKKLLYENLLYRPPVFEESRPELNQLIPMIQQKKDPKFAQLALKTTLGFLGGPIAMASLGITDTKEKKETKDTNLLRYAYALNFVRKFNKSSVLAEGLWKMGTAITDAVGAIPKETADAERNDVDKLLSYMDYNMSKDKKLSRMLGPINFLSNMGGLAADLYVGYQVTTGAATKFVQGAIKGLTDSKQALTMAQAFATTLKSGQQATKLQKGIYTTLKIAPPLLHAAADGAVGMVRETLNDAWLKGIKNLSVQQATMNARKYFAEYAIGDLLFFGIGKVFKNFVLSSGRFIKGFKPDNIKYGKFNEEMTKLLSMQPLDPVWFARQDDIVKETLRQTQAAWETAHRVERLTPEKAFGVFSGSKGFLSIPEGDGWKVLSIIDDKVKHTFKGEKAMDDAVKWIEDTIEKRGWTTLGNIPKSTSLKNIKLTGTLKGKLPNAPEQALKILTESIAPIGGKFTAEGVENFTKGFLRTGGAPDDILKGLKVTREGNTLKVLSGTTEIAELPIYAKNAGVEYQTIKRLSDKLNTLLPEEKILKEVLPTYTKEITKQALYTPSWVEEFVRQHQGSIQRLPDGKINALIQGRVISGNSYDEIADIILKDFASSDPAMFKNYLRNYHGINLQGPPKGPYLLKKGRSTIGGKSYKSVQDILSDYPELTPRIPSEYGPKVSLVNNASEVVYKRGALTGSDVDILTELSKFKELKTSTTPFKFKDAKIRPTGTQFEVTLDNLGFTETFNSMKNVQKFLEKGLFDKLEYIAPRKGFTLSTYKGQFHLTTADGVTYAANSMDEAAGLLANKAIMPEWAPELTGIDSQLAKSLKKLPGFQYKPNKIVPDIEPKRMSSMEIFQSVFRAPDQIFRKTMESGVEGGEMVLKQFRRLEDAREVALGMTQKLAPLIDNVFTLKSGKVLNKKNRKFLTMLSEIEPDKWDDFITKNKLNPELKEVANNLRTFYGRHADDGLFLYMGNEPGTFLQQYMPRVREFIDSKHMKNYVDGDVAGLLKDAFNNNIPTGLDVFFKHSRVSDIVDLAREMDAKTLLQKYIMLGHREKFLGPVVEDIGKWMMKNGSQVDDVLFKRFGAYLSDVVGIPSTAGEKLAQQFTERFFKELKIGDKVLAKNFTEVLMGTSYLATMGWKAWLPVKNSFQIWTTLAPRIGNTWTAKALEVLNKDKTGSIYKMLQQRGIITAGLPVGGAQLFKGGDITAKVLQSGLHWYKNSDSFTRAVAYLACKSRFDDAILRFEKGLISQKKFIDASGLWNLTEKRMDKALKLIDKGYADSAMDLFGRDIAIETMFPYRSGTSPLAYRGVIGKLFGQMGHYPVYYIENIARGLKRGSPMQRIGYATRFLANTTAIAGSLGAIGINSSNFLAWSPAQFTGGPWYDLLNNGIKLWGKGYEGRTARAKLLGIKTRDGKPYWDIGVLAKSQLVQMAVPGSLMFRSLSKAAEALNNGDYYKFIMNLGSVPLKP